MMHDAYKDVDFIFSKYTHIIRHVENYLDPID